MEHDFQSEDSSDNDFIPARTNPNQINVVTSDAPSERVIEEENSESENDGTSLNQSRPRSWIWLHGSKLEEKGKQYWKCNYCKRFVQL